VFFAGILGPISFISQPMSSIRVTNFNEKFSTFNDYWSPRISGELNDNYVKLAKLKGEFMWHHHEQEDEMFLVLRGTLRMGIRENGVERELIIRPGEYVIIPRGVEHLPIADEEVHVVLVEPKTTLNTGNIRDERTREELPTV
jgi:mannose-6-phosphate isomerase-like protein (cupin superfamily)